MREITETHIIELIKKYAKGGGDLLPYFKDTSMSFYVAINNNLTASRIGCTYEDVDGRGKSNFRFRTDFLPAFKVASGYEETYDWEIGDVIRAGSTFSFIEMVIGSQSNIYPVMDIGQSGYGAYQIPPNSDISSWTDSAGDSHRGLGSLLILSTFTGLEYDKSNLFSRIRGWLDDELEYTVPDNIAEEHSHDEVFPISDYMTRENRRLPASNSSSFNTVTIGGTQYTIGSRSDEGVRLWITDFTLTSDLTYISESEDDPVFRASDNKLVSLEVYV